MSQEHDHGEGDGRGTEGAAQGHQPPAEPVAAGEDHAPFGLGHADGMVQMEAGEVLDGPGTAPPAPNAENHANHKKQQGKSQYHCRK